VLVGTGLDGRGLLAIGSDTGVTELSNLYTKYGVAARSPVKTTNGQDRPSEGFISLYSVDDKAVHKSSSALDPLPPLTIPKQNNKKILHTAL